MADLKQLITDGDTWTSAEGENDGTPFLLRFRPHLQEFIASNNYTRHLTILWHHDTDDRSLMPSDDEMELMKHVEDALVDILETDVQSVLAFVYMGQSQKGWHWYSTDINETRNRINEALAEFDKLPIELCAEDDPHWSEYNKVLEGAADSEYHDTDEQ